MRSSKGFTMVEMVVGLLLLGMIIVVAMSFMVFQSRYGRTATAQRSAREAVALALNMMARDIRQAGHGLGDDLPEGTSINSFNLAILPDLADGTDEVQTYDDGTTHRCYNRLFVQNGMYLSEDPNVSPSVFDANAAPGGARYYKPGGGSSGPFPFAGMGIDLSTSSDLVKNTLKDNQIGGLIGFQVGAAANPRSTALLAYNTSPPNYSLSGSLTTANTYYVPAIVYSYAGAPDYALLRNNQVLVGGGTDIRVTGMCIRATFYDSASPTKEIQVPIAAKKFPECDITLLRYLMITLRYKIRQKIDTSDPEKPWSMAPEMKRTVMAAPRSIVMETALTQTAPLANP
ncbi:MAG: prepilin-type N-terminal cleavage/methylation domain-containing protein [Desulfomonile sp.]|nr:prepilin-type N-terminal cleavage/methylation domain-containing protein [Desulfomonile sp.]